MNTKLEEFNLHQERVRPIRELKHTLTIAKIHFDFFVKIAHSKTFYHDMNGKIVVDIITELFTLAQILLDKGLAGDNKTEQFLIAAINNLPLDNKVSCQLIAMKVEIKKLNNELILNGYKESDSHFTCISNIVDYFEKEWMGMSTLNKKSDIEDVHKTSNEKLVKIINNLDSIIDFIDPSLKTNINRVKTLNSELLVAQRKGLHDY
ncbi:hypothetical protein [Aeromonas fluvialis]|uniref:hypothetical protein n=1 Tax=Aeromonas fluvialis TaxID=591962 RepID=UPI0005A91CC4|nr:hypothetical protein [Aeromonas fluvialis]